MLFSSIEFIFLFLPASLLAYYAFPKGWRNTVLLLFSLLFYAWGEPKYLLLMVATVAVNFAIGKAIERQRHRARLLLATAVVFDLSVLGVFKYLSPTLNFFGIPFRSLALPAGISFYTFQLLSYAVDVYRGEKAQKSAVDFGLYVTMFPQLVAGPIVRYKDIAYQLKDRKADSRMLLCGISRFVSGLGKKLIFSGGADLMWQYFSSLPRDELSPLGAWLGIIFFAFRIYFDFSGYSDMAIGLGLFFGFDLPENFDYPYTARSVRDFWRRWHVSLTEWFKEYLYIPLGGSRGGALRTLLNILAVWLFTGIWHGASLNFLCWGLYYFLLVAGERFLFGKALDSLPQAFARLYTLGAVLVGWVFFASPGIGDALSYLRVMFSLAPPHSYEIYHLLRNLPFLILLALGSTPFPKAAASALYSKGLWRTAISLCQGALLILCVAELAGASYSPFLYFRF